MIGNKWDLILKPMFDNKDFKSDFDHIISLYNKTIIYPAKENIFRAFKLTDYDDVKVVILGQDPYHNGLADGLAFSSSGKKIPSSLKNIFLELSNDLNIEMPISPNLSKWAKQGILLLNTSLTVEKGKANSHKKYKWNLLTNYVIKKISDKGNVVFILWGNDAKEKISLINTENNLILTSAHPSPFSAYKYGFFGNNHFSKCNTYLYQKKMQEINWRL